MNVVKLEPLRQITLLLSSYPKLLLIFRANSAPVLLLAAAQLCHLQNSAIMSPVSDNTGFSRKLRKKQKSVYSAICW